MGASYIAQVHVCVLCNPSDNIMITHTYMYIETLNPTRQATVDVAKPTNNPRLLKALVEMTHHIRIFLEHCSNAVWVCVGMAILSPSLEK